jgi:signal peptidase II
MGVSILDEKMFPRSRSVVCAFGVIALDQMAKWCVHFGHRGGPISLGPFGMAFSRNHAYFLGLGEFLPPITRLSLHIALGVLVGVLLCTILVLYPPRRASYQLGLGALGGGVIGNVLDRVLWGFVIDPFYLDLLPKIRFNLADLSQWVGLGLLLYGLARHSRAPTAPRYRPRPLLLVVLVTAGCMAVTGAYSAAYYAASLQAVLARNDHPMRGHLAGFVAGYVILCLLMLVALLTAGLVAARRESSGNPSPAATAHAHDGCPNVEAPLGPASGAAP